MKTPETNLFFEKGWCQFEYDPDLANWVHQSLPAARRAISHPNNAKWLRHKDTWFVGVNALQNNEHGAVDNGPPISGHAVSYITENLNPGEFNWDQAQVSVCYPGYPGRSCAESESAYLYRLNRDAAHIDGLLREGPGRRRFLREYHAFILGIPMVEFSADAAPFVIWEGSHEITREVFSKYFQNVPFESWSKIDLTDMYKALRRQIFSQCHRTEISANPGQAYLVHRLALHGIAPWPDSATASRDGRMICYFRPEIGGPWEWLHRP